LRRQALALIVQADRLIDHRFKAPPSQGQAHDALPVQGWPWRPR
jgi:hypothetical protein